MVGIIIDRFGRDIRIKPISNTHFETVVDIAISPQFFGWLFGLGPCIRITAPDDAVKQFLEFGNNVMSNYTAVHN